MNEAHDEDDVKSIKRISILMTCLIPDHQITKDSIYLLLSELDDIRDWTSTLAETIAAQDESQRAATLRATEQREPERFGRLVAAAYAAYYGAPAGIARVARLAEGLPRSPSPWFDATALSSVIRDQRGRRTP